MIIHTRRRKQQQQQQQQQQKQNKAKIAAGLIWFLGS